MWAITPKGAGNKVSARSIESDWPLEEGETFTVNDYDPSMLLADNLTSLRSKTQAEIDADDLAVIESNRIQSIKDEGLARINVLHDSITELEQIKFYADFWQSIAPAARQATNSFQEVIDIYSTAKAAITDGTLLNDVVWP